MHRMDNIKILQERSKWMKFTHSVAALRKIVDHNYVDNI
jgi:hypothetical protein